MNKTVKWILIIVGIIITLILGFKIFIHIVFGGIFDEYYSKNDLIENYENRHQEIDKLVEYFNFIVPDSVVVDIEFDNNKELGIFHIKRNGKHKSNWNLKINSTQVDSMLLTLNWTTDTLHQLKLRLDNANCISIKNGNPTTVGFQRSGMGMYFYKIFDQSLSDSLINKYNDGCTYSFYKDNVVLEYGGGAIGPQCFEDFKREIKNE